MASKPAVEKNIFSKSVGATGGWAPSQTTQQFGGTLAPLAAGQNMTVPAEQWNTLMEHIRILSAGIPVPHAITDYGFQGQQGSSQQFAGRERVQQSETAGASPRSVSSKRSVARMSTGPKDKKQDPPPKRERINPENVEGYVAAATRFINTYERLPQTMEEVDKIPFLDEVESSVKTLANWKMTHKSDTTIPAREVLHDIGAVEWEKVVKIPVVFNALYKMVAMKKIDTIFRRDKRDVEEDLAKTLNHKTMANGLAAFDRLFTYEGMKADSDSGHWLTRKDFGQIAEVWSKIEPKAAAEADEIGRAHV